MKKDNRGFSLVELIVVVAMISILAGAMAYNIGRLSGYRAKECRTKVVSSLENTKTQTLSKSKQVAANAESADVVVSFFKNTNNGCNYCITVVNGEIRDVKKISQTRVTLYYYNGASGSTSTVDLNAIMALGPGRGSAGWHKIPELDAKVGGVSVKNLNTSMAQADLLAIANSGMMVAFNRANGAMLPTTGGHYCTVITSVSGNYQYPIALHALTGKIETGERTKIN